MSASQSSTDSGKVKLTSPVQALTQLGDLLEEQDLGQWRRTHYSSEVSPSIGDKEVVVMGWVASVRDHGNIQFIILKDINGEMQVTAKKGECSDSLFEMSKEIKEHSSIGVRGKVRPQEK